MKYEILRKYWELDLTSFGLARHRHLIKDFYLNRIDSSFLSYCILQTRYLLYTHRNCNR